MRATAWSICDQKITPNLGNVVRNLKKKKNHIPRRNLRELPTWLEKGSLFLQPSPQNLKNFKNNILYNSYGQNNIVPYHYTQNMSLKFNKNVRKFSQIFEKS